MDFFKNLFRSTSRQKKGNSKEIYSNTSTPENTQAKQSLDNLNEIIKQKEQVSKVGNDKTDISPTEQLSSKSEKKFEAELYESLRKYYSMPDPAYQFAINLTGDDGTIYKPHQAFNAIFDRWKEINSKWDRISLIFEFWDGSDFQKLSKWQVIERYNNDRQPLQALKYQTNNIKQNEYNEVNLLVALAKMNRLLSNLSKAREIIDYIFEYAPDQHKVKVELANILHLSDNEKDKQRAHEIINKIIEEKIKNEDTTKISLLNYFRFSKDYIDSSVFAASFLIAGSATLDDWDEMANEYYYCPVFRYEHAVKLSKSGDAIHALAKLNALADEFPWYKTGVIGAIEAISQMRVQMKNPTVMELELKKLKHYLAQ